MRVESLRDLLSQFPDPEGFWDFDDLQKTELTIRELLLKEEQSPSVGSAELLTQLARVQGLQGKLSEAGATLLQIKELIAKPPGKPADPSEVRFLLEQGRFFGLSMNSAQSLAYFGKAWDQAQKQNDIFSSIETAVMLSISQPPKYKNDWLLKALNMAETSNEPRAKAWLPQLYTMSAWHSFDFRRYEEALESFKKAITQSKNGKSFSLQWSLARTLRALNRIPEALEIQQQLLSDLQSVGKVNGHVYLEMAECLQLLKKQDEAKINFELAYKELSLNGWYADNKSLELSRIQHLYKKK